MWVDWIFHTERKTVENSCEKTTSYFGYANRCPCRVWREKNWVNLKICGKRQHWFSPAITNPKAKKMWANIQFKLSLATVKLGWTKWMIIQYNHCMLMWRSSFGLCLEVYGQKRNRMMNFASKSFNSRFWNPEYSIH